MKNLNKSEASEKAKLMEKRSALQAKLNAIQNDYKKGLDSDSEERASQLANAEVQAGIAKVTMEELERIEALINKLDMK